MTSIFAFGSSVLTGIGVISSPSGTLTFSTGVMTGAVASFTAMTKVWVVVLPAASETVTVTTEEPVSFGVPEIVLVSGS